MEKQHLSLFLPPRGLLPVAKRNEDASKLQYVGRAVEALADSEVVEVGAVSSLPVDRERKRERFYLYKKEEN